MKFVDFLTGWFNDNLVISEPLWFFILMSGEAKRLEGESISLKAPCAKLLVIDNPRIILGEAMVLTGEADYWDLFPLRVFSLNLFLNL